MVLASFLCEESYALVLVAWLYADCLWGDVAFVLVLGSAKDSIDKKWTKVCWKVIDGLS